MMNKMNWKWIVIVFAIIICCFMYKSINNVQAREKFSIKDNDTKEDISLVSPTFNKTALPEYQLYAQNIYEHILNEDWNWLLEKYDLPENNVTKTEDLMYLFKRCSPLNELESGHFYIRDQGYILKEINEQKEGNKVFVTIQIINQHSASASIILEIEPFGEGAYILSRDVHDTSGNRVRIFDFYENIYNAIKNENGFDGQILVVPKDYKDITLRGIPLKEEWRDDDILKYIRKQVNNEDIHELIYTNTELYKAYRIWIPLTYLVPNSIPDDDNDFYDFYGLSHPQPFILQAINGTGKKVSFDELTFLNIGQQKRTVIVAAENSFVGY